MLCLGHQAKRASKTVTTHHYTDVANVNITNMAVSTMTVSNKVVSGMAIPMAVSNKAAPTMGVPISNKVAPTMGVPTSNKVAPTMGVPISNKAAPTMGIPVSNKVAPTMGVPTSNKAAPTMCVPTSNKAAPTMGVPTSNKVAPTMGVPISKAVPCKAVSSPLRRLWLSPPQQSVLAAHSSVDGDSLNALRCRRQRRRSFGSQSAGKENVENGSERPTSGSSQQDGRKLAALQSRDSSSNIDALVTNTRKATNNNLILGHLKLAIDVNKEMVTVHVMQARRLSCGSQTQCHSYVQVSLLPGATEGEVCKTDVVYDSNHPQFDDKLSIGLLESDQRRRLLITLWHKSSKSGRAESLGCMSFSIKHLMSNEQRLSGWYYLLCERLGQRKHIRVPDQTPTTGCLRKIPKINTNLVGLESHTVCVQRSGGGGGEGYGFTLTGSCPVRVGSVSSTGPAQLAGLRPADVVTRLNGRNVSRATLNSVTRIIRLCEQDLVIVVHRYKGCMIGSVADSLPHLCAGHQAARPTPMGTCPGPPGTRHSPPGTRPSPLGTRPSRPATRPSPLGTRLSPPNTTRPSPLGTCSSPPGTCPSPPATHPSPPNTTYPSPLTTRPSPQATRPNQPVTRPSPLATRPSPLATRPSRPVASRQRTGPGSSSHQSLQRLKAQFKASLCSTHTSCSSAEQMRWDPCMSPIARLDTATHFVESVTLEESSFFCPLVANSTAADTPAYTTANTTGNSMRTLRKAAAFADLLAPDLTRGTASEPSVMLPWPPDCSLATDVDSDSDDEMDGRKEDAFLADDKVRIHRSTLDISDMDGASESRLAAAVCDVVRCEQVFVHNMQRGMQGYSRPLRHRIISTRQHAALFQNIEKLVMISQYHIGELSATNHCQAETSLATATTLPCVGITNVGDIYKPKLAMLCSAYASYDCGMPQALDMLTKLHQSTQFYHFIKNISVQADLRSIEDFLLKPAEHFEDLLTKLQTVICCLCPEDAGYDNLAEVISEINATCCRVVPFDSTHSLLEAPASLAGEEEKLGPSPYASSSSSVNTHHSVGSELLQLQRRITFAEGIERCALAVGRRHLIFSGELLWQQECGPCRPVWVLLLSDMLLLTVPSSHGPPQHTGQLVVEDPIYLRDIVEMQFACSQPSEFLLETRKMNVAPRRYAMRAVDREQKCAWKTILEHRMNAYRAQRDLSL